MIYKKSLLILIFFFGIFFSGNIIAKENKLDLYFFSATGCPHCENENIFLKKMEDKYDELIVHNLEITASEENRSFFEEASRKLGIKSNGVPMTIIGEKHFVGFGSEDATGALIEKAIQEGLENEKDNIDNQNKNIISLPVLGEIDTKRLSLPVLTIIIGGLDGFNPCAMWVLAFLISLLLGMEDRKKMWIFGGVFIFSSATVYFLFMTAWLNLFLFLGFILWVRLIIAGVALFSGFYYLRDYHTNKEGACKVEGGGKKKKIFDKLREIVHEKTFWLALVGIFILAFAVNLVELICSAGLPAVFTQVLALSELPSWQYYAYLLLYIVIFMLDDLIVFFIAMITLQSIGISGKYCRYSRLVGGIIMLIIGVLLIFRPEWLMFG